MKKIFAMLLVLSMVLGLCACGKSAAQIAKTMGAFLPFAFLQIFLSVLQTLQLVLFLCKLCLGSFLFGSKLFKGFRFCHCD